MSGSVKTRVRTNDTRNSLCKVEVPPIEFRKLWDAYPKDHHPYVDPKTNKAPPGYENQCAIRVSAALHGAGVEMKSYTGASVALNGMKAAVVATQLSQWLSLQPFCGLPKTAENITGKDWEGKIKGRTGIVYFENYWKRKGETKVATGDHIDLWNGSGLTPNAANRLRRMGIDSIQWLPGFLDDLNFSDLANSSRILFWEIR